MTDPTGPELHLVPAPGGDVPAAAEEPPAEEARDPLLARAERIPELPLAERPAAFEGLDRAVVAELNTLEGG